MANNPNDFIVRLEGLKLDGPARARISAAIQSAVVGELGKLDMAPLQSSNHLVFLPIRWPGLWLRQINEIPGAVQEFGKTLSVREE